MLLDKKKDKSEQEQKEDEEPCSKALVLGGKRGLLGQAIVQFLQEKGWQVIPQGREDVNILDIQKLFDYVNQVSPDCIFNTIAYTNVEQAEDDKEWAYKLNQVFPRILCRAVKNCQSTLVHYSTDFVFDGKKPSAYTEEDPARPLCLYGKSKLAGEKEILNSGLDDFLIIRSSWLFGPWKTNFVQKMLDFSKKKNTLPVVHDQIGSPTYTLDLAQYSLKLLQKSGRGIFHLCNCGQASWCELAAEAVGITGNNCTIQPIPSSDFPQKAKRPGFSVLDPAKFCAQVNEKPRPWLQALRDYLFTYQNVDLQADD